MDVLRHDALLFSLTKNADTNTSSPEALLDFAFSSSSWFPRQCEKARRPGLLSHQFFLLFLLFGYAFATLISIGSVLLEGMTYRRYNRACDVARLLPTACSSTSPTVSSR